MPSLKPGETCHTSGEYSCSGTRRRTCRVVIVVSRGAQMPPCGICRQEEISWEMVSRLAGSALNPSPDRQVE